MPIDDEKLMAFADGELTGAEAQAIAQAIAADPALAEKLAGHRRLKDQLGQAFDPALSEPVPAALTAAVAGGGREPAQVVDLNSARERRTGRERRSAPPGAGIRRKMLVQRWGSLAATLAVGIVAGQVIGLDRGLVRERGGELVARTELASALDDQLASDDPALRDSPVRIGLTFRNQQNQYCRTFAAAQADSMSGIACRHKGHWEVRLAATGAPQPGPQGYRTAGSDEAILQAAQAMMKGDPFDTEAEARARAKTWKDGQHIN